MIAFIVLGLVVVVGLLVWLARTMTRQQATMRGGAPDLRRADDSEPPLSDPNSPLG